MACLIESLSAGPRFFFESLWHLLRAINPFAVAALFLASFGQYSWRQRNAMARTACWVALGLLATFALWGRPIMDVLGIGIPSLRVACGFALAVVSFRFLCSGDDADGGETSSVPLFTKKRPNMAVVPLAIPLIAGPGPLVTAIEQFHSSFGLFHQIAVLSAIAVAVMLVYVCLFVASLLCSALSLTLRKLFFRIGGLLLFAVAIQQVLLGLREVEPIAHLFAP
ncbi:MAG: MarC family protein [Puniceicoccales bacterium]|jgi:multiple antibiotic resistance protein|nr:MarC family protein [Puniceicoccales bacterium]